LKEVEALAVDYFDYVSIAKEDDADLIAQLKACKERIGKLEEELRQAKMAGSANYQNGDAFREMVSLLTSEDYKGIYRVLAKRFHPDTGGSHEKMLKLNQLFERLGVL
jgi:hypothetical protein